VSAERDPDRCRSCGAAAEWVRTESGKLMPIQPEEGGNVRVVSNAVTGARIAIVVDAGQGTHAPHFAWCPQAASWRRR
jgi:hypothetical protein